MKEFGGKARFVVENYGESELAKRFGVKRYPAIFVDDVLVATPKDFGFYGKGEGTGEGRYAPFIQSSANHERFRADLSRMVGLILAGRKDDVRAQAVSAESKEIPALPPLQLTDLDGKPLTHQELAGRVVLVEFWATWCPPCPGTLAWLGEVKKRHGDRLAVIAVALESEKADVRKLADKLKLPFFWTLGTPELARSFGDISAVPTLFLFDQEGRTAEVFFGAPPELHQEAEAKISSLIERGSSR